MRVFCSNGCPSHTSPAPLLSVTAYFGHVGWGFRVGQQNDWFYGATEGRNGAAIIAAPDDNGAWVDEGNWDKMLDTFAGDLKGNWDKINGKWNQMLDTFADALKDGKDTKHTYSHSANYYTQFRCRDTISSDVPSAENLAYSMIFCGGYRCNQYYFRLHRWYRPAALLIYPAK